VTIPNSPKAVTGKVTMVAKVAQSSSSSSSSGSSSSSQSSSSSSSSSPTVALTITLDDASATGTLDQAPVTVSIISQSRSAKGVLAIPISALLAVQEGGYAVEVIDSNGHTRFLKVQTGLFDDQDGLVQVTGTGISEGTQVVVPSIS
jgi:multidrug efflux pump subunit AcrA (membrane-fusion protein)